MDGAEFFNMLFGSEQFEHLIGELVIATAARWALGGGRPGAAARGGPASLHLAWSCGVSPQGCGSGPAMSGLEGSERP